MTRTFWIAISFLIAGSILLVLPDKGEPIISFNEMHGPSVIDLVGLILFSIGWIWLTTNVILGWKKVIESLGYSKTILLLLLYITGIVLIILGLRNAQDVLLWTGVFLAVISNALLVYQAFRNPVQYK